MNDTPHILIADDKPENLFTMKQILAETGAEVISADNGNDALIASLNHEFALAILDVQMPDMNGYELAEILRSEKKTASVPIIFVSAVYSSDYHVFKGYSAGAVDFMVKPFDAKILLSKVAVFLDLDRQKEELRKSKEQIIRQLNQLKASEKRFESLVLTVPDIVYRIDPEGRFTFINHAIEKLGYHSDELLGRHFSEIILPIDLDKSTLAQVQTHWENTPNAGPAKLFDERRTGERKTTGLEIRLIPKKEGEQLSGTLQVIGDETVVVEVNSAGLYSDDVSSPQKIFIGTVGVIRDITDRKRLEESLKRANDELEERVRQRTEQLMKKNRTLEVVIEQRKEAEKKSLEAKKEWEEIFEAVGHMALILDTDYNILAVNRSVLEATGKSKAALVGRKCHHIFHGNQGAPENCVMASALASGKTQTVETQFDALGKTYIVSVTPLVNDDGKVHKLIHIATDITQRKRLEKELIQAHKMEAIGTLAGGIAHDFNNILSALLGFSELSLRGVEPGTVLEDDLKEINKAANRAKDLVNQILTFARQSDDVFMPLRVDLIIKEVIKFIRSTIPASIDICQNVQSKAKIMASATQMHQVMMNLCSNAAHAMTEDGGTLTVSLLESELTDKKNDMGLPCGSYLSLEVSDTGPGIPPEIIERIFEPYFTTKVQGEGTGMGLAVVQGIITETGGAISVESHLGKGASFTIFLPVTEKEINESPLLKPIIKTEAKEHILLVDDEIMVLKALGRLLSNAGYTVTTHQTPSAALEAFSDSPGQFDLLITDMTMPKISGDRLIRKMLSIRPDFPTILCSGYNKKLNRGETLPAGTNAFLPKPVDQDKLFETVRRVLRENT